MPTLCFCISITWKCCQVKGSATSSAHPTLNAARHAWHFKNTVSGLDLHINACSVLLRVTVWLRSWQFSPANNHLFFILQSKSVGAEGHDIISWQGRQQARSGVAERLIAPDVDQTCSVPVLQVWKWPILPISFNSWRPGWVLCSDRHTDRCWRTHRWGGRHGSWTQEWIWMEPSGFRRTDRRTLTGEKGLMRMWKWVWCDGRSDSFLGARSSQPERIASHWRCTRCKARFKGVWNLPC